ncbi:MAG: PorV/PorQ family protein [Salinivirgaceae bacterium]|nr:PorV/PorQ family protein [Salinivirgaceae bacterium]MDD4747666.1 PorV/PorQ family protein [Salinivirgaceae bacterium]MDY0280705.1 PorV/PorQ family protein [Salinivirgaceae bacterium]
MIIKKATFLLLLSIFTLGLINAQVVRKYSNEFLSIGVGARGVGMGNSVIATTTDVYSTYYNPAGLLSMSDKVAVGYMHSEYFAGIAKYDYGAVAYKISDDQVAGLSFIRFGVDNIPNTLNLYADGVLNYDRITSFSVADMAIVGSYAQKIPIENLYVGGNVKIIRRVAGDFANAWGFGFDVGARYLYKEWIFAANIRDITGTFNAWSYNNDELREVFEVTGNELPTNSLEVTTPRIIAAAAYRYVIRERFKILGEINLDITTDKKRNTLIRTNFISMDPQMGVEISIDDIVYARFGLRNLQQEVKTEGKKGYTIMPSIGAGLQINKLGIDYAYTDIGNVSGALYSHVVSLHYHFNHSPKKTSSNTL